MPADDGLGLYDDQDAGPNGDQERKRVVQKSRSKEFKVGLPTGNHESPEFCDFASKPSRTVYHSGHPSHSGLVISPDQRRILSKPIERPQNHELMVVEPFR